MNKNLRCAICGQFRPCDAEKFFWSKDAEARVVEAWAYIDAQKRKAGNGMTVSPGLYRVNRCVLKTHEFLDLCSLAFNFCRQGQRISAQFFADHADGRKPEDSTLYAVQYTPHPDAPFERTPGGGVTVR